MSIGIVNLTLHVYIFNKEIDDPNFQQVLRGLQLKKGIPNSKVYRFGATQSMIIRMCTWRLILVVLFELPGTYWYS